MYAYGLLALKHPSSFRTKRSVLANPILFISNFKILTKRIFLRLMVALFWNPELALDCIELVSLIFSFKIAQSVCFNSY